jgi:hypothetical protein
MNSSMYNEQLETCEDALSTIQCLTYQIYFNLCFGLGLNIAYFISTKI